MANLETLELRVSANAQEATKGLGKLISSLIALSKNLTAPVEKLTKLNEELIKLKGLSKSTFNAVTASAQKTKSIKKTTDAIEEQTEAVKKLNAEGGNRNVQNHPQWAIDAQAAHDRAMEIERKRKEEMGDAYNTSTFWEIHPQAREIYMKQHAGEIEAFREATRERQRQNEAMREAFRLRQQEKKATNTQSVNQHTDAIKRQTKAIDERTEATKRSAKETSKAAKENIAVSADEAKAFADSQSKMDVLRMKREGTLASLGKELGKDDKNNFRIGSLTERYKKLTDAIKGTDTASQKAAKSAEMQAAQLERVKASTERIKAQTEQASARTEKLRKETALLGQESSSVKKISNAFSKMLSTIGRIAKTMLIRTAIRAIMKGAKEGLDNFYQYAKKVGNGYAESLDKVASKWQQIKNQMGATLGSALQSFLPIIHVLSEALLGVLNAVSMLLAVMQGKTTYTRAKEVVSEYGKETEKASAATKELLASFDELNVIASEAGSGAGSGGVDYGDMFEEAELPSWMIEWGDVIRAVVLGTLGAVILPKIFDWIKKILGLFGAGGGASTALDILKKLFDPGNKFADMPDIASQVVQMGLYAGAAEAAKLAIDGLKESVLALKGALEGISVLGTVVELVLGLLSSFVGDHTTKIKVDDEEFEKFKKKFEEFKELNGTTTIKVEINDDVAKITQLVLWVGNPETKTIKVELTSYEVRLGVLEAWVNKVDTKKIDIDFVNYEVRFAVLNAWINKEETKTINVDIVYDTITYMLLTAWANTNVTKKVNVDIGYDSVTFAVLNAWINSDATKNVKVDIAFDAVSKAVFDLWINAPATKKVNVSINYDAEELKTLASWIDTRENKYVDFYIIDNADGINKIQEWIDTRGTKYVDIQLSNGSNSGSDATQETGSGNGGVVGKIKEWADIIKDFFLGSDKSLVEVPVGDVISLAPDKTFNHRLGVFVDEWNNVLMEELDDKPHYVTASLTYDADKTKKTATSMATVVTSNKPNMTAALTYSGTTAKTTRDKLAKYVTDKKPKMTSALTYTSSAAKTTTANLAKYVTGKKPKMTSALEYNGNSARNTANNLAGYITGTHPTMTSFAGFVTGAMTGLKSQVESLHPTMKVDAKVDESPTSSLATGFKRIIKLAFGAFGMTVQPKANGGLVTSGDLFIANENGNAEMIGKFGNHAAVANQEQMVEAMARGVQYANAEQNGLLREQNRLLTAILQKESSVRLEASSALGRTAKRSIDMYNGLYGGR